MRRLALGVLLFLTSLLVFGEPGLIDQPQTFPWTVGMTPSGLEEAGPLLPGGVSVQTSVLWLNTFRQAGFGNSLIQQVDMEAWAATVTGRWVFASGWEARAQVQGWTVGGGVLDSFLSAFHGRLLLPNQGRELTGEGHYRDFLAGRFDETVPTAGLTQISGSVRGVLGPWAWSAWVKPPLPAPVDWGWTDRWTAGSGFTWGDSWLPFGLGWRLGAGLGVFALVLDREPSFVGPTGGPAGQFGFYTSVEPPWGGLRALVEGNWSSVPRRGEGYLPQGPGLLTVGVQVPVLEDWFAEFAVTEEFLTWATNEVGFQVGLQWNHAGSGETP